MLLTSSQVSVAISSVIVVIFTSALFFSGYAIQQRTLRELRAAIKPEPRPSPKIFLPDRFRKSTTELPDGTIVVIDDNGDDQMPRWMREKLAKEARARAAAAEMMIEVKKTVPEDGPGAQKVMKQEKSPKKNTKKQSSSSKSNKEKGQWDKNLVANPDDASKKPVSRAERRRLIKEEIKRLSQEERPMYYQRRLW